MAKTGEAGKTTSIPLARVFSPFACGQLIVCSQMHGFPPFYSHLYTLAPGAIIHASPRAADDAVSDSIPSSPPPCDEITISVSYTSTLHTVIAPALCSVADVKAVLANHFGIPSSAASCLVYAGRNACSDSAGCFTALTYQLITKTIQFGL
jgi:hypothetical protein